jgi:hypothetical protein
MNKEELEAYVNSIKHELPLPSEVPTDMLTIPYPEPYDLGTQRPTFSQIVLEKDIHDGIAIGWKIKGTKS